MEIGWSDEEILEAIAHLALNEFQSLIASAAALPKDQATPKCSPRRRKPPRAQSSTTVAV